MPVILLNILLLVMEARALYYCVIGRRLRIWVFYTQLSNMTAVLSTVLLLTVGSPTWVVWLRYLGACMLLMTFLVTSCVLVPMGASAKVLLFSESGLYHHTLCPAVFLLSYVFFEQHAGRGALLLPVLVTLAYGIMMLYMNWRRIVDGPYPFFKVHEQSAVATVLWIAVLLCAITAVSAAVLWIAR